ncbi:sigma-E factor negative regulatory protein [Paraglaciecola hydrolytica]|uniref:Anti-sigma-E factor RseA n=1 Tax=Paraglaciecola hydrolytica TaxID=1799789 RepID=A0A136A0A8_9ALTE|nr:RseA family anti-sigma factor [Paraglaciecola hydrolytica]KXI28688.1 transcriptional regulator [Paraglaciecola hydrolytica]
MSQKFENLSALVDGENSQFDLQGNELITAIKNDKDLEQKWHSYHVIRYGLRKELPQQMQFDIAAKVMLALESEPAILAPKRNWRDLPVLGSVIPFVKQGGQMAIAASVAVAMIIGVQQFNQNEADQPFNSAAPILGIPGGLSPVSFEQTNTMPQNDMMEQRRRINAFIADHQQQMRLKSVELNITPSSVEQPAKNDFQPEILNDTP